MRRRNSAKTQSKRLTEESLAADKARRQALLRIQIRTTQTEFEVAVNLGDMLRVQGMHDDARIEATDPKWSDAPEPLLVAQD